MTKAYDRQSRMFYSYRIEDRLYIIRRTSSGYTLTFIKQGRGVYSMNGLTVNYRSN